MELIPLRKAFGAHYTRLILKFQAKFIANNNCMHEILNRDNYVDGIGSVVEEEKRKW